MNIGHINIKKEIMVIAEIGNNHEGSFEIAEKLIKLASSAGADAVKFQTIEPSNLVSPNEKKRFEQLKKFEISKENYIKLSKISKQEGLIFLSTPFSINAVNFLNPIVPAFKIASSDNNHIPLIERVADTNKPIILSTGMCSMKELEISVSKIKRIWKKNKINPGIVLLHCVSSYPTQPKFANLKAIRTISSLGELVGYSDHTVGIEAALVSVGLGARIIEKHFTLSKNFSDFRDHKISSEPKEFKELVLRVKEANKMLGHGEKKILEPEKPIAKQARRSICAAHDLKSGKILIYSDLTWLRPSGGIPPGFENKIVGRRLKKNVTSGEQIRMENLD